MSVCVWGGACASVCGCVFSDVLADEICVVGIFGCCLHDFCILFCPLKGSVELVSGHDVLLRVKIRKIVRQQ